MRRRAFFLVLKRASGNSDPESGARVLIDRSIGDSEPLSRARGDGECLESEFDNEWLPGVDHGCHSYSK